MAETLLEVLVAAAVLGGAALVTQLFARNMYNRCPDCAALNAKRRAACRLCGARINP